MGVRRIFVRSRDGNEKYSSVPKYLIITWTGGGKKISHSKRIKSIYTLLSTRKALYKYNEKKKTLKQKLS